MSKYVIYSSADNKIWRDLDFYELQKDGSIIGGLNDSEGKFTYLAQTNPAILEIAPIEWDLLDQEHLDKYIVEDGEIVEDPDYEPYQSPDYKEGYDQAVLDLIEMGVL